MIKKTFAYVMLLAITLYSIDVVAYEDLGKGLPVTTSVSELEDLGIMKKHGNYFNPDSNISRIEFLNLSLSASGIKPSVNALSLPNLKDVKAYDWFAPYVSFAIRFDLITYNDRSFRPYDPIAVDDALGVLAKLNNIPDSNIRDEFTSRNLNDFSGDFLSRSSAALLVHHLLTMNTRGDEIYKHGSVIDKSKLLFSPIGDTVHNYSFGEDGIVDSIRRTKDYHIDLIFMEKFAGKMNKIGGASAIAVSPSGLAITSKHVTQNESFGDRTIIKASVGGRIYDAKIVAEDPLFDLALIQVDANLAVPPMGAIETVNVGDPIFTYGNALGEYEGNVTRGIVSALNRTVLAKGDDGFVSTLAGVIQSDAAMAKGYSGGALFSQRGELIGMNSAVDVRSQGHSFAIPSMYIKQAVDSYIENSKIIRPFYGIRFVGMTASIAAAHNMNTTEGVMIYGMDRDNGVAKGGPADRAGLKMGDVIIEFDGHRIDREHNMLQYSSA
jgi:S1-C subfamily serine protease